MARLNRMDRECPSQIAPRLDQGRLPLVGGGRQVLERDRGPAERVRALGDAVEIERWLLDRRRAEQLLERLDMRAFMRTDHLRLVGKSAAQRANLLGLGIERRLQ